jgi:hypothetical protein
MQQVKVDEILRGQRASQFEPTYKPTYKPSTAVTLAKLERAVEEQGNAPGLSARIERERAKERGATRQPTMADINRAKGPVHPAALAATAYRDRYGSSNKMTRSGHRRYNP